MKLPDGHWIYSDEIEPAPVPLRRHELAEMVRAAARYAIRASTMRGRCADFDPDVMVQNFVIGMLGDQS